MKTNFKISNTKSLKKYLIEAGLPDKTPSNNHLKTIRVWKGIVLATFEVRSV